MNKQPGAAHLGEAIANIVASVVHKAVLSVLPHANNERNNATRSLLSEMNDVAQTDIAPLMGHLLDTGKVHPLLEPAVKRMAGR